MILKLLVLDNICKPYGPNITKSQLSYQAEVIGGGYMLFSETMRYEALLLNPWRLDALKG